MIAWRATLSRVAFGVVLSNNPMAKPSPAPRARLRPRSAQPMNRPQETSCQESANQSGRNALYRDKYRLVQRRMLVFVGNQSGESANRAKNRRKERADQGAIPQRWP